MYVSLCLLSDSCDVTEVIVYPRRDCCFDRYAEMEVKIELKLIEIDYRECGDYEEAGDCIYREIDEYNEYNEEGDYQECKPTYVFDSNFVQNNMDVGLKFMCWPKVRGKKVVVTTPKGTPNQIAEIEVFCN